MWFALAIVLGCGASEAPTATQPPGASPAAPVAPKVEPVLIDVATFHTRHAAGEVGLLVDVRTPQEFAAGHVPGAVNIPVDQVGKRLDQIKPPEGQPVYVICEVGGRSAAAAAELAANGYPVVDVGGGTRAWRAAGHPVE